MPIWTGLWSKKNNRKESFHLNRIILCLGILRWGDERPSLAPLTRAVSDKHTWQLGADRTSAFDSSQGSYEINNRLRNWITKQKKREKKNLCPWHGPEREGAVPKENGGIIAPRRCSLWKQSAKALFTPLSHFKGPVGEICATALKSKFPRVKIDLVSFLCSWTDWQNWQLLNAI